MTSSRVSRSERYAPVVGLTASRGVAAALQAGSYVLVARASPPADAGRVLAALAVAAAVVAVIDLGVSNHAMRELGRGTLSGNAVLDLWMLRVTSAAAGGILWVLVTTPWRASLAGVGAFVVGESLLGLVSSAAIACRRVRLAAGIGLLARGLTLALVGLTSSSARELPWLLAAGSCTAMFVGTYALRDLVGGRTRGPRVRPGVIRETWHYMTSGALVQLSNLDVPIVAAISGASAAGFYGLPSRLTTPLTLVAQSHANVVLPRAAAAWQERDAPELHAIRRSVLLVAGACVAPLAVMFATAHVLVPAALGGDYRGAIAPLRVIAVAVALTTVNGPLIALLQAVGRSRTVAATMFLAVPCGLLGVAAGAAAGGTAGAGIGLVVMQAIILARLWPELTVEMSRTADGRSG